MLTCDSGPRVPVVPIHSTAIRIGNMRNEIIQGSVLDPFMGSGTTGMVARQHGRDYLGIELNPEYIALIKKRISTAEQPLFT